MFFTHEYFFENIAWLYLHRTLAILLRIRRGKNEINPCLIAYNHSHLKTQCFMAIWSSSVWMHSFSTVYVLCTHTAKTHPEILLFCWFLASQVKIKIIIYIITTTLSKIASRKPTPEDDVGSLPWQRVPKSAQLASSAAGSGIR